MLRDQTDDKLPLHPGSTYIEMLQNCPCVVIIDVDDWVDQSKHSKYNHNHVKAMSYSAYRGPIITLTSLHIQNNVPHFALKYASKSHLTFTKIWSAENDERRINLRQHKSLGHSSSQCVLHLPLFLPKDWLIETWEVNKIVLNQFN